ncbi:uncharacterized protein TNCV_3469471 [Trichonephila clavipes]|nr:uncharacterized protein TNCV_3469471 [Trichonephila clavipes]
MWPSSSHNLKHDPSVEIIWCQSARQAMCSHAHYRCSRQRFALKGILYKGNHTRNAWCRRRQRIYEADTSIPVSVDLSTTKCLEEAASLFTTMRSLYQSSRADVTIRRRVPVFRVVRCSSVDCFQPGITVELLCCTRAPIA